MTYNQDMEFSFMVVDDAPFVREVLKSNLISLGGKFVGEADSGVLAMEHYQKVLPDLVILDLVMPDQNGLETAKAMKEVWAECIIVVCSTLEKENFHERAKLAGCDDYLEKPFTKAEIEILVQKHFSNSKKEVGDE